jgi:hypothetical protein
MTARKLHALALVSTAFALVAGTAEAARTPTTQGMVSAPSSAATVDASAQLDGARHYGGRFVFRQAKS